MNTLESANASAAIYARVSSDAQAQEQTIDSQVAELREQVHNDGASLDDKNCFLDDGVSGSTLNRPALERLRDAAYVGDFQKLYVHSPDRLARKYAYQVLIVDELQKQGIEIVFLNRAIGVSPEEDLLLQMQGMFAEYERAKIMERSRRGKRHAATLPIRALQHSGRLAWARVERNCERSAITPRRRVARVLPTIRT